VEFVNNAFIDNGRDVDFHSTSVSQLARFSNNYFANAGYSAKTNGEAMGTNFVNGGNAAFANLAAFDFRPLAGSVLIGRGADLSSSFNVDNDGKARAGAWDIGAFEFGAGPSAPVNLTVK
jgi:hypothetical protein